MDTNFITTKMKIGGRKSIFKNQCTPISTKMDASQPPPPPLPPPPSSIPEIPTARIQRYKLAWRVFMIGNLGLGAYIFARAKMKDSNVKTQKAQLPSPLPLPTTTPEPTADNVEEPEIASSTPIADLVKVCEPVPEDQQRELFQWILDEKRKIKPRNKDDKKRIDDEKAILKMFIRSESVPPL
ncbi:hypothetical protein RND81_06G187800 [Saponaria officinalis]|uniref:Uncharacterized protein n=1 Tax=Saponaria officinalis TaxID=3572 RepID=A0AAW1KDA3_SAPOF